MRTAKTKLYAESIWPAKKIMAHLEISKSHLFQLQKKLGFTKYRFPALNAESTGYGRVYFNVDEILSALEAVEEN